MEFVVNEWLPEYFRPGAKIEEKQKLEKFLNIFLFRNDKIYVRRPSPFLEKLYKDAKTFQNDQKVVDNIRFFIKTILLDSDKCIFVEDDDFTLNESTKNRLLEGGNTVSDTYLFEAASNSPLKMVVTTDTKLRDLLINDIFYKVILLDEFLSTYY